MHFHKRFLACLSASLLLGAGTATAQADYFESFDGLGTFTNGQLGPPALIQRGWIFRNQSDPGPGIWTWREGPYQLAGCGYDTFDAQAGAGYLGADAKSADWYGGTPADWAILPVIPGQQAGDEISFFARQVLPRAVTLLEVRYSPSGGTDTGSGTQGIGDFTTLLLAVHPPTDTGWTYYTVPLPGAGRLAFRYTTDQPENPCQQAVGIDSLHVGPSAGPCSDYPDIPTAGQSVTWTAADSPHRICAFTVIPATATVVVEAGAQVLVDPGSILEVRGNLVVQPGASLDTPYLGSIHVYGRADFLGTSASRIQLTGGPRSEYANAPERIAAMDGGLVLARGVELRTTLSALGTGVVLAEDLQVVGTNNGFYGAGDELTYGGTFAIRDSSFAPDSKIWTSGSYLLLDRCTFDDATLRAGRPWVGQTLLLDNLVARNRLTDSVFHLMGADYFFGPGNSITGNAYPVRLEGGGIARGSVLPASGNNSNRIHMGPAFAEGRVHWANVGIPYLVTSTDVLGDSIEVDPGVTIQMSANASVLVYYGGTFNLEGLPEAPIQIMRRNVASPWGSIDYGAAAHREKVEYVQFVGGQEALTAEVANLHVESCTFQDNHVGLDSYSEGHIYARGNRILDNDIGARSDVDSGPAGYQGWIDMDGGPNPNWLEGNGIGLRTFGTYAPDHARDNYWGDPSGPTHIDNPGGQGDSAIGYCYVMPFRSEQPIANHPPVVRLEEHSALLEEGTKHILHWTASDDDRIRSFRILYAPHGEDPELRVIADRIPGSARSWEVVIPEAPPDNNYPRQSSFRVEATDTHGQTGWDHIFFRTPWLHDYNGGYLPDDPSGVQRPGQRFLITGQGWGDQQGGTPDSFLWLDADGQVRPYGYPGLPHEMPPISTDLARILVTYTVGAGGRISYGFSNYFSIRPDPSIGDAPPQIQLLSPNAGDAYDGGGSVSLEWTASDDEGLRSFDVHASYDSGRTWSTVVRDLAPDRRSYAWRLPPSTGIPSVQVRVIAHDLRFQNSSSTSGSFLIRAGPRTGDYRQTH